MRLWGSMNVSLLQEPLVGNYSVTHHPTTNQDHILTRHIQVMVNYLQSASGHTKKAFVFTGTGLPSLSN